MWKKQNLQNKIETFRINSKRKKEYKAKQKAWLNWASRISKNSVLLDAVSNEIIRPGVMNSAYVDYLSKKDYKMLRAWITDMEVKFCNHLTRKNEFAQGGAINVEELHKKFFDTGNGGRWIR